MRLIAEYADVQDNSTVRLSEKEKRDADRKIAELLGIPFVDSPRVKVKEPASKQKKSEKACAYSKEWYEKNKALTKLRSMQWKMDNPDKVKKMSNDRLVQAKAERERERERNEGLQYKREPTAGTEGPR